MDDEDPPAGGVAPAAEPRDNDGQAGPDGPRDRSNGAGGRGRGVPVEVRRSAGPGPVEDAREGDGYDPVAAAFALIGAFAGLRPEVRARLHGFARHAILDHGEAVFRFGYIGGAHTFVVRGWVKLVRPGPDGRDTIIEVVGPGELISPEAVGCPAPRAYAALPLLCGAEVISVLDDALDAAAHDAPDLALALSRAAGLRVRRLTTRVAHLGARRVEQRLACVLLDLADRRGPGDRVAPPLTRQDLADLCGTTAESAIRTMRRLETDGVVRTRARRMHIEDRSALQRIAAGA